MKKYFGRMFIGGKWLMWHLIDGLHENEISARARFMKDTRLVDSEVEITDIEPAVFAGKYKLDGSRKI